MNGTRQLRRDVALLVSASIVAAVLAPAPVAAYLDPLSGSIILQFLVAGFLAASLTVKKFWHRISDGLRDVWVKLVGDR